MLEPIKNTTQYKERFLNQLEKTLSMNSEFKLFIDKVLAIGTAFVVGGFLRDIANQKNSRDLDMILDLPHKSILQFLERSNLFFQINRMEGIKIVLENFEVDLWSIDNNWAFKHSLVKKNNDRILNSIANGCFYNFDSLALNIKTRKFVARGYNQCIENGELDIIQKRDAYKQKNPTIEANILKAFYLQKVFGLSYSENCLTYLERRIDYLEKRHSDPISRLMDCMLKYKKYQPFLDKNDLICLTNKVKEDAKVFKRNHNQLSTELSLFLPNDNY